MIPEQALNLMTKKGFFIRFFQVYKPEMTYREGYELVEQEHNKYFGKNHYASYAIFRNAKCRMSREEMNQLVCIANNNQNK